jgi:hypothetical protein
MTKETRALVRKVVLLASAAFLILLLPFMFDLWPGGFRWVHPSPHPPYERMIIAIYFSLGICLIPTALDPARHSMLIDFTILSSILHGAVMTYDSFAQDHIVCNRNAVFYFAKSDGPITGKWGAVSIE